MKKILLLLVLFCGQLIALDKKSTLDFYQHIFVALTSASPIKVYVEDKEYRDVFRYANKIVIVKKMQDSDVILLTNKTMLEKVLSQRNTNLTKAKRPLLFATDYHLLKASKEVIGAFYWKKGRSQLLFVKMRLDAHGITLSKEYQRYIVDEL